MTERTYTAFFPFCGIGGGALGFQRAAVRILGTDARFRVLGGVDLDAEACQDFEHLTGAPALAADIGMLGSDRLRAIAGHEAPDVVFLSPPCKGASGLLSEAKSRTAPYQRMNRLALDWIELMLATWDVPPRLVLLENVPRLRQRAGGMLRKVRALLRGAGYVIHEGFHECGEIGGLAQIRKRFLLVARHAGRVPPLLYQPPVKRVRGCGEVLGELPVPASPEAEPWGALHRMPRLSWLNWIRLSLIPAGGDWRDLPGVLEEGEERRGKFRRHHVEDWNDPSVTVAGSGSNGPSAIADPRAFGRHYGKLRVESWQRPAHTVTGSDRVGSGAPSVGDPRIALPHAFGNVLRVVPWTEPTGTVTSSSSPSSGGVAIADIRAPEAFRGIYGVLRWEEPSVTVTGRSMPSTGRFAVADPRLPPDAPPLELIELRKAPVLPPVIIAADGTWHRPLTTLELAALQGFPTLVRGEPLRLCGTRTSAWRERIGNAVPPPAAEAIAERMLVALVQADAETFVLGGSTTPVWVRETRVN